MYKWIDAEVTHVAKHKSESLAAIVHCPFII